MLMNDHAIRKAIQDGEIVLENFNERFLQSASYDMRLGDEAITSSRREKIYPAKSGLLTIAPGDFALAATYEYIELPATIAGHIGLRSAYAKKGIVLLSGPQIDPGFKGVLVVGLSNLSPRDVVIPYKSSFCTVEFFRLEEAATGLYDGEYQSQRGISSKDLQNIAEAQAMTFGQVITSLQELSQNVKSLSDSVAFLKWAFPALLALGIAIISIIVAIV